MNIASVAVVVITMVACCVAPLPAAFAEVASPMPSDEKVAGIILDFEELYEVLTQQLPKEAVIDAADFPAALGPTLAAKLNRRQAVRIVIHQDQVHISLAHKVTESGQVLATTLEPEISFVTANAGGKAMIRNLTGVTVKPKLLPFGIGTAQVQSLAFSPDCAGNTVVEVKLSPSAILKSPQVMVLSPDGRQLPDRADCTD